LTIRKKTLLIIGLTLIGLIGVLYATSSIILMGGFIELERQNTRQNVQRALDALFDDIANLDYITRHGSRWDETYNLIENVNGHYIKSNLNDTTIAELRLNLLVYINPSGQIVYNVGFDLKNKKRTTVLDSLQEHLIRQKPLSTTSEYK